MYFEENCRGIIAPVVNMQYKYRVFDYSKSPMQHKRGHKIIKPLENNNLIR